MTTSPFIAVVGTDFSTLSSGAFKAAVDLAQGAALSTGVTPQVHLLHVVAPEGAAMDVGPTRQFAEALSSASNEQLQKELASLTIPDGVKVTTITRFGTANREIAAYAKEVGADIIFLGTHGRKGLDRMLFGSVAEKVVREAECSVVVVRPREPRAEELIEPGCPECERARQETKDPHAHCNMHGRPSTVPHLHYEKPKRFGVGWMNFRAD